MIPREFDKTVVQRGGRVRQRLPDVLRVQRATLTPMFRAGTPMTTRIKNAALMVSRSIRVLPVIDSCLIP